MKQATTLLSATVLLAGCLLQSACAEPPPMTGPVYDFDWHLSGDAEARPYQVFDDGRKIYLQFADPKRVPAVFADTAGGLLLLHWRADPPYIIVDQMENALVFRASEREARALRAAPSRPPQAAHFGAAQPAVLMPAASSADVNRTSDAASEDR
ncbi:conjugative transfer protein CagX [Paraburkholderia sp. BL23I1N1]|uniref:TrbG/VirB9 family P-type conjugative transfer protein n=1 Tax=unclassified Paraburkholderia TaxID=2615204 RepID=UPI000A509281|nr:MULTISPECIES: TrbG/VirB9 family P-type conjugative transfer protein [unclassified Paraburkholderia]REE18620.1 conjugative transfer protein CagX [Paraburkholderia sp. BL27I4N3]RKE35634.1 conjugative transfer protein CagX [Paraburkholderia sp. BL23I1N1]TCK94699.1 conjugative transfer protein CagX [Paraburkholderia sp. BL9I2N2]